MDPHEGQAIDEERAAAGFVPDPGRETGSATSSIRSTGEGAAFTHP